MNEAELDELFGTIDDCYQEDDENIADKINVFDIINDISEHGTFIESFFETNKTLPKEYTSFMIDKAFANYPDTVLFANEMNKHWKLPLEMHWRFMKNAVEKRKRRSKWYKGIEDREPIELLASYFDCTINEMRKNINALTKEEQLEILKKVDPERYREKK